MKTLTMMDDGGLVFAENVVALAWQGHLCEGGEVAGHVMLGLAGSSHVAPLRHLLLADVLRQPASRVEAAARRRIERRGYVAFQDDALAPHLRVGDRYGRKQRVGVRV